MLNVVKVRMQMLPSRISIFTLVVLTNVFAQDCQRRNYDPDGIVCVCNSTYCDSIARPQQVERPRCLRYTSNKKGLRFEKFESDFSETNEISENEIRINRNDKCQTVLGWGGAFSDATGINLNSLDPEAQERLLKSYFSQDGIEYSLCRVPIGGTDFSERAYSYDDGPADPELNNFQLAPEDVQYKIPHIKRALNLTNNNLKFFASAWTAPKWMKTNNDYSGFGFLRTDMYQTWAEYFVKFLDKYKEQGIDFWGITTGNEPSLALIPISKINSIAWTPGMMASWILNNLGPTIRNSSYSHIKIMALDDQRFFLPWYISLTLNNKNVRNFVDGIAVHWYYDFLFPPSLLKDTHDLFPEKFLLATEACVGDKFWEKHVDLGSWERGEQYSFDIIEDLQNWVAGWVDWNMALNLQGGPTYISNFVDSPIIVNASAREFYKQPMFYHLGHFSKFVPPESVRIGVSNVGKKLEVVAFQRPDNGTAVIILNRKNVDVSIALIDNERGTTRLNLSERSITTVLYW